jgi:hypothetical protein
VPPLLDLGPVTVANGTAIVSGKVGGAHVASAHVAVDGQPLAIDARGAFAGTVKLSGRSVLEVSIRNVANGEVSTADVPLASAVAGVIPAGTIGAVEQALAGIVPPSGGFTALNGQPLSVGGRVADGGQLAQLSLNGIDLLKLLGPDGSFAVQLPGTTKTVTIKAADNRGTSATTTRSVTHVTSAARTQSVAAAGAVGVRITAVRYTTGRVRKTHRLRMTVTVKDRLGRLVQGAAVRIRSSNARLMTKRAQAARTTKAGTATFTIKVRGRALGRRLFVVATVKTPSASASRKPS